MSQSADRTTNSRTIWTLHRYYIWANRMRSHFDEMLESDISSDSSSDWEGTVGRYLVIPYMSYWYAGLYVAIEGWTELKLADATIDDLLAQADEVSKLKRYRNGAFHFQSNYFDERFLEFVGTRTTAVWARQVTQEFGRWFLDWYAKAGSQQRR